MTKESPSRRCPLDRSQARAVRSAARTKASRPDVAGPARSRQRQSAHGVVRPVARERRDESGWNVSPARRARRSSPAEIKRPLTLPKTSVRSRSKTPERTRASEDVLRGAARVAPSRPVREAPCRSQKKAELVRSNYVEFRGKCIFSSASCSPPVVK